MNKFDNTIKHDPPHAWGDCHRVCHAMILGLRPENVPHYYDGGDGNVARGRIKEFLAKFRLTEATTAYPGEAATVEDVLSTTGMMMPGVPFILGGTSRSGCGHSVVCLNGEVFHDPAGSGIVGPLDGFYFVTVLAALPNHAEPYTRLEKTLTESFQAYVKEGASMHIGRYLTHAVRGLLMGEKR